MTPPRRSLARGGAAIPDAGRAARATAILGRTLLVEPHRQDAADPPDDAREIVDRVVVEPGENPNRSRAEE